VATSTAVLFGGIGARPPHNGSFGDTWTWNGTTWTKQAPAAHPSARFDAAMANDAATSTAVLFGGAGRANNLSDTWTWNGTTWAKQTPATHPAARSDPAMAYDAATGTVILFGGSGSKGPLADAWTWG
jgi:hypothetical protein